MLNNNHPNFMIIGAAKSGTTTLHHLLNQHPQIYLPSAKETHFFDLDYQFEKGEEFYLKTYYSGVTKEHSVIGDATPSYLRFPNKVIPRIQNMIKHDNLKFFVMLRDPVQRAWSHYLHTVRIGEETLSFSDALEQETDRLSNFPDKWFGYFNDGLYASQLNEWFKYFPRENFKIFSLEQLRDGPEKILCLSHQFLNVDQSFQSTDYLPKNQLRTMRSAWIMKLVRGKFSGAKHIKKWVPFHSRRIIVDRLINLNTKPTNREDAIIDKDIEMALRKKYLSSVIQLEELLDRDFAQWKI